MLLLLNWDHQGISIHAPRVGSDHYYELAVQAAEGFQSTLPVWGATFSENRQDKRHNYFNPRSPCGERLFVDYFLYFVIIFQSTLPVWGAT